MAHLVRGPPQPGFTPWGSRIVTDISPGLCLTYFSSDPSFTSIPESDKEQTDTSASASAIDAQTSSNADAHNNEPDEIADGNNDMDPNSIDRDDNENIHRNNAINHEVDNVDTSTDNNNSDINSTPQSPNSSPVRVSTERYPEGQIHINSDGTMDVSPSSSYCDSPSSETIPLRRDVSPLPRHCDSNGENKFPWSFMTSLKQNPHTPN